MYKKYFILLSIILFALSNKSIAGTEKDSVSKSKQSFALGLRFQKAGGFYWSNGITAEYFNKKIWKNKMSIGFNFVSSKMGTALGSNAISFFEADLSATKYFRNSKNLKPLLRLNAGYARANFGSEVFKNIPNQSMLLSLETGASYEFKFPLKIALSGGVNFISGNGISGLGTIFPVYAQFSMLLKLSDFKK